MKSLISNFILACTFIGLPIALGNQFLHADITQMITKNTPTDTSSTYTYQVIDYKLDSLEIETKYIHEKTAAQLATDNQILQNKKEELLQLVVCLDSVSNNSVVENNYNVACDTIN